MALAVEFRDALPVSPLARNGRGLGAGPIHDRDAADAVFWAALDHAVAVGDIHQDIALVVEETDDLQGLEDETAAFIENTLSVL